MCIYIYTHIYIYIYILIHTYAYTFLGVAYPMDIITRDLLVTIQRWRSYEILPIDKVTHTYIHTHAYTCAYEYAYIHT